MVDSDMAMIFEDDGTQQVALHLRRRDVVYLQSLVEQYQHRLVRYLLYFTGRREGVDDLVQETWLRVLERGASYDGRCRFEPWLFTIARNLAIDTMRRQRTLSLDSAGSGSGQDAGSYDTSEARHIPVCPADSPFALAARSEDAERLAGSMQSLEPIYREVLVLRFQEEMSMQEIAIVTGAPISTISSRIYRGLAILRTHLEGARHAS